MILAPDSSFPVLRAHGLVLLTVLLMTGCGHLGLAQKQSTETVATGAGTVEGHSGPATKETPKYPDVELSESLLYDLLLGEIALQRHDFKTAADAMSRAAESTKDPRLAERAARAAMEAGLLDEALAAAKAWAELEPENETAKEVSALVLVEKGQTDQAEELLGQVLDADEQNRGLNYRRIADMLSRRGDGAAGLALMQSLVERHPDTAEGFYALAFLADRAKRPELVVDALDRALALRPDWEEAAQAKIAHLASLKKTKEVITFADQFLARNPEAKRLRLNYARYLVEHNEDEKALAQFEVTVKQEPANADALFAAGYLSLQLKHYDKAEGFFNNNLKLRPDHAQTRLYLGQLAVDRKRYKEARKWYESVSDHDENNYFEAQVALANVIAKTDGADAAIAHLEGLQASDETQYVRVTLTKELILREAKDLKRAKVILDDAVGEYPENSELLYARGLVAAQLHLLEVHEHDMRKLLAKDPKNAHALNALGYTLADATDRFDEAHALIEQALAIRPNDPFILDSMGWVQYRMGNLDLAIKYLERALSKREDAEIAAHLGEVLWTTGDRERAEKVWNDALKKYPKNDVLRGTIKKLKQ